MKKRVSCKTGKEASLNRFGCWLTGDQSYPDNKANGYRSSINQISTNTLHTAYDLGIGFNEVSGIY